MLIGYFIVKAEPAVAVLTKQVEEVTNGSISKHSIMLSLSIGVAFSVGIAMLRILTGIPVFAFLIPGYLIALSMTFFVPQLFTGIAFDSGGVASGPMTATFLLPLAMGACEALGGNIMQDAFGIVAMVAMTPLLTIQILGMVSRLKQRASKRRLQLQLQDMTDSIIYFD
jgi:cytochrome c oxidase assembly factor CtaG